MITERLGAFLLVSSPQNSKDDKMQSNNLFEEPIFDRIANKFDVILNLNPRGCLHANKQIASVVMSVAAHNTFVAHLREEMEPGNLFIRNNAFRLYLTGHSIGEMASLIEAGYTELDQIARFLEIREKVMANPIGSGIKRMFAIVGIDIDKFELPHSEIADTFGNKVEVVMANRNSPTEGVLSVDAKEGTQESIQAQLHGILEQQKHPLAKRFRVVTLPITNAFHASFNSVEESILNSQTDSLFSENSLRVPIPGFVYSPMLRDWIGTRKQMLQVIRHQLTLGVYFSEAMSKFASMPDIVAIITADVTGITPKMVSDNLRGVRDIPILNIKDRESLKISVQTAADLLHRYNSSV